MKLKLKRSWIALAALVVAGLQSSANAATPVSPILTNAPAWDCLLSGKDSEQGVVFLTFIGTGYDTNSLFEVSMVHTRAKKPILDDNDRSPIGDIRNPTNGSATVTSNLFGYVNTVGGWAFDYKGYVVGSFNHLIIVDGTNTVTNMFSFKGKVSSNKRLTASYSTTLGGNGTIKGVPMKTVTNVAGITGSWTGAETDKTVSYYEWFSLVPDSQHPLVPNLYSLNGYGPAYGLEGYCLVSSQKRIAFGNYRTNVVSDGTNSITYRSYRASVGPLSNKKTVFGGKMKGLSSNTTNVISYESFRVAP